MKISEMSASERPRERMRSHGPSEMGDGELLAVLLRNGTAREGVVELAGRLLASFGGNLVGLFSAGREALMAIPGIGPEKACSIMAAAELGRRFMHAKMSVEKVPLTGPRRVYELMVPILKGLQQEQLWVLFLNKAGYLTGKARMSSGGIDSTTFDARVIMGESLHRKACSIVLVHNHPAGNPRPSEADRRNTAAIHHACVSLGITLMDHVIISDDSFYSFTDERLYCGTA